MPTRVQSSRPSAVVISPGAMKKQRCERPHSALDGKPLTLVNWHRNNINQTNQKV